jgi:hypothetical protein
MTTETKPAPKTEPKVEEKPAVKPIEDFPGNDKAKLKQVYKLPSGNTIVLGGD